MEHFWNWFLGFVEGKGSFIILVNKDMFTFRLTLSQKDEEGLYQIEELLKKEGISTSRTKYALHVNSKKGIEAIIGKLQSLGWITKKRKSFDIFTDAFYAYHSACLPLTPELFEKLIDLKLSCNEVSPNKRRKNKEYLLNQYRLK